MMRLWFCFQLFALFLVSSASQISSVTLVDALSADPDYTSIIRLLQRARLIPTLNRLNGSTFFAPTNDAIERHLSKHPLWHAALHDQDLDQQTLGIYDNVADRLRQQLFYHLLNYTLPAISADSNPEVHKTLLFPREFIEPPTNEPPSTPPWMPVPGGTLGGEPQRLRVSSSDGAVWVGVDAFGGGGAQVVKSPVDAGNGLLLGISEVLNMPPDLCECITVDRPESFLIYSAATVVSQHTSTSYFHKILTPEIVELLNTTSELTLFLPVDEAWLKLHPLERLYLESPFATDDLSRILNAHAVVEKDVKWSDSFEAALNCESLSRNRRLALSPWTSDNS
jgi:solute carrier family 25 (mitochondrial carnitine/acylcarnitine transporter), member 20/29